MILRDDRDRGKRLVQRPKGKPRSDNVNTIIITHDISIITQDLIFHRRTS